MQGRNLIIGNLGDSRAILGTRDKDNQLMAVQLTVDLKPNIPSMLYIFLPTFFSLLFLFNLIIFYIYIFLSPLLCHHIFFVCGLLILL